MKWVAAKLVPHLLKEEQTGSRVFVCCDLQEQLKNDPQFLTKVVRGDDSWCYSYDPSFKAAVKSVEVTEFTQTKKSVASSLKCQDNVEFSLSLSLFLNVWTGQAQGDGSSRTSSKSAVSLECVGRIA